ncbi:MAG TPA: patatin-like phospholipase family protein [Terriglobales bacterium]|nr:patatin-like phospholipase family protein [Terriglobales bacterium]
MPTFAQVKAAELKEVEMLRGRREPEVHGEKPRVGLAFSGGGIRSATINLGILQGLAKRGLLKRLDYLSTVSGGGFIGGWLTRWIRERGIEEVEQQLGNTTKEPPPVNFLRDYSNYLTPRKGLLGADTWAAIATYLRNVILNQTILAGFLGTVLTLPWILGSNFDFGPFAGWEPWVVGIGTGLLIAFAVARAVVNTATCLGGESRPFARQRGVLLTVVLPLFAGAFLLTYGIWRDPNLWTLQLSVAIGAGVYTLGHLSGWIVSKLSFRDLPGAAPSFLNVLWAVPCGAFAGVEVYGLRRLVEYWSVDSLTGRWEAASWGPPLFVVAFLLAGTLHIGLAKFALRNEIQEWWARLGGWLLLWSLFWAAMFSLAIFAPLGVTMLGKYVWARKALLLGWAAHSAIGARLGWGSQTSGTGPNGKWKEIVAKLAPFIFVAGLLVLVSCGVHALVLHGSGLPFDDTTYWEFADAISLPWLWILLGILAGATAFLSWRVDINLFSMNLLYRNRLVRCYLGASNEARQEQPFTGFDPRDDVRLASFAEREPGDNGKSEDCKPYSGPYPILNATLNVTHGERLAWQERKAESFVFTPLYCGYEYPEMKPSENLVPTLNVPEGGYQPTNEWAFPPVGVKLGLAISTSGAAVSPNMGYHTYPPLAFLMTVFNVRLGEWLPNPRYSNADYRLRLKKPQGGPGFSLLYLLNELFASTTDRSKYVYLSDGAHFENLAIYELVRRECEFIIASDAGEDPGYTFGDLINAIRKCRTDLGAEIDLNLEPFRPNAKGYARTHAVRGEIRYRNGKVGQLLFFKSCLTGDESNDVLDYRREQPAFPQQSTADQWFDESQFESYRALGQFAAESMISRAAHSKPSLEEVIAAAPTE